MTDAQKLNRDKENHTAAAWMVARAAGVTARDIVAFTAGFDEGYRKALEFVRLGLEDGVRS